MNQPVKRLTKVEILEDTVKFYSEDVKRRAYDKGNCSYCMDDGRLCAFGRYMIEPEKFKGSSISAAGLMEVNDEGELLREEALGHSGRFWNDIQELHDCSHYWDDNGLSNEGTERAQEISECHDGEADD